MNIRRATIEDADRIHEIVLAAFGTDQAPLDLIKMQLERGHVAYLLADENQGFLSFRKIIDETVISFVAVDPSQQGQKIGQQLLAECLKQVADGKVFLEVAENNPVARHLYEKAGFEIYARREKYYHDGQTAILMEKVL